MEMLIFLITLMSFAQVGAAPPETDLLLEEQLSLDSIRQDYQTVASTFQVKCAACHDSSREVPTYGAVLKSINPVNKDIVLAQRAIDIKGGYPFSSSARLPQKKLLLALKKALETNSMPPVQYTLIHWDAKLTPAETDLLSNWATRSIAVIEANEKRAIGSAALTYQTKKIEESAAKLLRKSCAACHSETGPANYVFDDVTDFQKLARIGFIDPSQPQKSRLIESIRSGAMPKGGPRMSDAQIKLIEEAVSKFDFSRGCVSEYSLEGEALLDLLSREAKSRPFTRYISMSPFAESSRDEKRQTQFAFLKVLNSISWKKNIVVPEVTGKSLLLYRVDLRDLGLSIQDWENIVRTTELRPIHSRLDEQFIRGASGTGSLTLRADVFMAQVLREPLYSSLLRISGQASLEQALGVNLEGDIRSNQIVRSGFLNSGVSSNNRIIERHATRYGAYWISYDFANNQLQRDIFRNPNDFQRDGGEIIFNLPNGLQGYMLVDKNGNRLGKAPIEIVSDRERPDYAVENSISCMRCHASGILDRADEITPYVKSHSSFFNKETQGNVAARYADSDRFSSLVKKDSDRLAASLEKIDARISLKDRTAKFDSVTQLLRDFEKNLSSTQAACELGVSTAQLSKILKSNFFNSSKLLAAESIQRSAFSSEYRSLLNALVKDGSSSYEIGKTIVEIQKTSEARRKRENEERIAQEKELAIKKLEQDRILAAKRAEEAKLLAIKRAEEAKLLAERQKILDKEKAKRFEAEQIELRKREKIAAAQQKVRDEELAEQKRVEAIRLKKEAELQEAARIARQQLAEQQRQELVEQQRQEQEKKIARKKEQDLVREAKRIKLLKLSAFQTPEEFIQILKNAITGDEDPETKKMMREMIVRHVPRFYEMKPNAKTNQEFTSIMKYLTNS